MVLYHVGSIHIIICIKPFDSNATICEKMCRIILVLILNCLDVFSQFSLIYLLQTKTLSCNNIFINSSICAMTWNSFQFYLLIIKYAHKIFRHCPRKSVAIFQWKQLPTTCSKHKSNSQIQLRRLSTKNRTVYGLTPCLIIGSDSVLDWNAMAKKINKMLFRQCQSFISANNLHWSDKKGIIL